MVGMVLLRHNADTDSHESHLKMSDSSCRRFHHLRYTGRDVWKVDAVKPLAFSAQRSDRTQLCFSYPNTSASTPREHLGHVYSKSVTQVKTSIQERHRLTYAAFATLLAPPQYN